MSHRCCRIVPSAAIRPTPWGIRLIAGLLPYICAAVGQAYAGPHEGGTLILHANPEMAYTHANPEMAYTPDRIEYCGQSDLTSCREAITSVPADPTWMSLFFAIAAFPMDASPELIGASFAIDYDPARFVLVASGSCGDYEVNTPDWPLPGSGTAVAWDLPQGQHLVELRWFAGYASDEGVPTEFSVASHPTEGGLFIGDWPGTPLDEIADYGKLGFGMEGYLPCPDGPVPTDERSWGGLKALFR